MTKEQQDQIQAMLNEWSKLDSPPDMAIKIFSEALTKSIQKEEQKRLIIEIMNEDAKDGLYETYFTADDLKAAYYAGYIDGQTNHINDAEQYINAQVYLKNK